MTKNKSQLYLDLLPDEVLLKTFSYLNPEFLPIIKRVKKEYMSKLLDTAKANEFWRKKTKKHFREQYDQFIKANKLKTSINWYKNFYKFYQQAYHHLPKQKRKLFSLVKEGDLESLRKSDFELFDLDLKDDQGESLFYWAHINTKHRQALLNFFFERALKYFQIENGNRVCVKRCDSRRRTILLWTIRLNKSVSVVEKFILLGADIHHKATIYSPLHVAVLYRQVEIAKVLIKYGAKLNEGSSQPGVTPLLYAVEKQDQEMVNILLENGANINLSLEETTDFHKKHNAEKGDKPLHVAVKQGDIGIVRALLTKKANIKELLSYGSNAFHLAVQHGKLDIVRLFIEQDPQIIDSRSDAGATGLLFAIEHNQKAIFDLLLEHKANINLRLVKSTTYHQEFNVYQNDQLLHAAIKLGRIDFVRSLIEEGVIPDDKSLQLAAEYGQAEIAKCLIIHKAKINCRTPRGATPLLLAAEQGHHHVVNLLLRYHADVSIPLTTQNPFHDKFNAIEGDTPLHVAARLGHTTIVRSLIYHGANILTLNSQQQTAADVAKKNVAGELKLMTHLLKVNKNLVKDYSTTSLIGYFARRHRAKAIEHNKEAIYETGLFRRPA